MRLWHPSIIPFLPGSLLSQLHRTVCNLRGSGWGRQKGLWLVWNDNPSVLWCYHLKVTQEMALRGWEYDKYWEMERPEPSDGFLIDFQSDVQDGRFSWPHLDKMLARDLDRLRVWYGKKERKSWESDPPRI